MSNPISESEHQRQPVFIVSPGRSGSTALDRALNTHPGIAVISELFEPALDNKILATDRNVRGMEFLKMLTAPTMHGRRRVWAEAKTPECLYLPDQDRRRSLLLCYTLPAIVGTDPVSIEDAFDELCVVVSKWAPATPAEHLLRLFDYLTKLAGKQVWVERTGGSAYIIGSIFAAYPEARVVHLIRHGVDVAISMANHPVFQAILAHVKGSSPSHEPRPVADFARFWTAGVIATIEQLMPRDSRSWCEIFYEDLVGASAETELLDLATFLLDEDEPTELDRDWARKASATLYARSGREALPANQRAEIEAACAEGLVAFGYELQEVAYAHPR